MGYDAKPPVARRDATTETLHGVTVADPYRWLEDPQDPDVQAWTAAQAAHARAHLDALGGRDAIRARLESVYYMDAISAPKRRGDRLFYTRRRADRDKSLFCWRAIDGPEHTLIDPETLSDDGSLAVRAVFPSPDGRRALYTLHVNNADEASLRLMDVDTGHVHPLQLDGVRFSAPVWSPDGSGFYYSFTPSDPAIPEPERLGHTETRYHTLGQDPARDVCVREATGDPTTFTHVDLSHDGRWLIFGIYRGWSSNDIHVRDLHQGPDAPWVPLIQGLDAQFELTAWGDHFYISTDLDAPRGRICALPAEAAPSDPSTWRTLVPERDDATLESARVVGGRLALAYLKDAYSQLEWVDLDTGARAPIALPPNTAVGGLWGEPDHDALYVHVSALVAPSKIEVVSAKTGERGAPWARLELPIEPGRFEVTQEWATSRDGTRVPMFVATLKDAPRDGSTPFILYGYGGFLSSLRPSFRPFIIPWLEAGGGWAMANLRGGGEYGESWHRAGMGAQKQNVFDDFAACAERLVALDHTRPERLAAYGGSNGGLLVGAAMTQRPDLFGAIVCSAPLLDMLRYHRFGLGKAWIPEYGSPDDPDLFPVLSAYSPYHNVTPGTDYPALLMLSPDSDDRVDPLHARKMVAAVQHASSGDAPCLLRVERNAGHGGADMIRADVEMGADIQAFLAARFGLTPAPYPPENA